MRRTVYVSRFSSWAPGLASPGDWDEWAAGKREIAVSGESPALNFSNAGKLALPPKEFALFKRRLSQISRMAIHVLHELLSAADDVKTGDVKTVFVSFRGEIQQQFKINRMLIQDGELGPAAFSQSVFNTPPALASIALGLTAGYTAVYPPEGRFDTGFLAAAAPLLSGKAGESPLRETALVYADEQCPDEYKCRERYAPLAFAALLKAEAPGISVSENHTASPEEFLKYLYRNRSGT